MRVLTITRCLQNDRALNCLRGTRPVARSSFELATVYPLVVRYDTTRALLGGLGGVSKTTNERSVARARR